MRDMASDHMSRLHKSHGKYTSWKYVCNTDFLGQNHVCLRIPTTLFPGPSNSKNLKHFPRSQWATPNKGPQCPLTPHQSGGSTVSKITFCRIYPN